MARNKKEEKLNYREELAKLKATGPQRMYLLWGREDYLREQYLTQLKSICLPEGESGFNFRRFDGPALSAEALEEAIDSVPFLAERSFVEIRDADLNKLKDDVERIISAIKDIPEYCTVCFVQGPDYEPDGRIKLVKAIRSGGCEIKFTQQEQGALLDWISRRFAAHGKRIDFEAAQRLIFISGDLMNRLIPEIDKIAAYCTGDRVEVRDVDAVATHTPEAQIFDLTDHIAEKRTNRAFDVLAELLANSDNEPIAILSVLGNQMRRLYFARLCSDKGLRAKYLVDNGVIKYEFAAQQLMRLARGFSLKQLEDAVELCANTDHLMKSGGGDRRELLKNAVLSICVEAADAQG